MSMRTTEPVDHTTPVTCDHCHHERDPDYCRYFGTGGHFHDMEVICMSCAGDGPIPCGCGELPEVAPGLSGYDWQAICHDCYDGDHRFGSGATEAKALESWDAMRELDELITPREYAEQQAELARDREQCQREDEDDARRDTNG